MNKWQIKEGNFTEIILEKIQSSIAIKKRLGTKASIVIKSNFFRGPGKCRAKYKLTSTGKCMTTLALNRQFHQTQFSCSHFLFIRLYTM